MTSSSRNMRSASKASAKSLSSRSAGLLGTAVNLILLFFIICSVFNFQTNSAAKPDKRTVSYGVQFDTVLRHLSDVSLQNSAGNGNDTVVASTPKQSSNVSTKVSPDKKSEASELAAVTKVNGTSAKKETSEKTNGTSANSSESTVNKASELLNKLKVLVADNKNAVQYVMFGLIGLTSLVVLYFIVKTMR